MSTLRFLNKTTLRFLNNHNKCNYIYQFMAISGILYRFPWSMMNNHVIFSGSLVTSATGTHC